MCELHFLSYPQLILTLFDRVCIRPEVSRTKTIGKKGVSVGVDFNKHLQFVSLNKDPVDFTKMNLTYLKKVRLCCTFRFV